MLKVIAFCVAFILLIVMMGCVGVATIALVCHMLMNDMDFDDLMEEEYES